MLNSKTFRRIGAAIAVLGAAIAVPTAASAGSFLTDTLGPRAEMTYQLPLSNWQSGTVAIQGSGTSDLDLFVYDSQNNLVCESVSISDTESCDLFAMVGQTATVKVRNLGYVANTFVIAFE